ncbi:MAG: NAD/NADP octopine/nopaline dehydrogenase family protein [Actinomycetota bacterium]
MTVLGAGSGGLAAAADLALEGHEVHLFNRSHEPLRPIRDRRGIAIKGALGDRLVPIAQTSTDFAEAISDAEAIVVVLPATAHGPVAASLAKHRARTPLILDPGHMCGSLHVRRVFAEHRAVCPPIAEFGTLTHVCRSLAPGSVDIYLRARSIPLATSPRNRELATFAGRLFSGGVEVSNPIEAWLSDVNMMLHPPGMVLGSAWIESSRGSFRFYSEGVTPAVAKTMRALDEERCSVGRSFGFELPPLEATMAAIGTADASSAREGDLASAVRLGAANASIQAPSSLDHRYLHEDIAFGLVPLAALARIAGVTMPVTDALIQLAETITGRSYRQEGLNERKLGIVGCDRDSLKALIEEAA